MGGRTKRGWEDPRDWDHGAGEGPAGTGVGPDTAGRGSVQSVRAMIFKITLLSAVVKQYNKYEK